MKYHINADTCKGCTACVTKCPVNAIRGEKKKPHRIDETVCVKCGVCKTVCKLNAVEVN
jgi:NAD-dependent dihydropyrimidine dehydrogenase PreA subunit